MHKVHSRQGYVFVDKFTFSTLGNFAYIRQVLIVFVAFGRRQPLVDYLGNIVTFSILSRSPLPSTEAAFV